MCNELRETHEYELFTINSGNSVIGTQQHVQI